MASVTGPVHVLHVGSDAPVAARAVARLEADLDDVVVHTAATARAGLNCLDAEPVDAVVSGADLPERDAVGFLQEVRERHPDLPFVLLTGEGSEAVASAAISAGVTDYIRTEEWADDPGGLADRLLSVVDTDARRAPLRRERPQERSFAETVLDTFDDIVYVFDTDLDFVWWNEQALEVSGYTGAELLEMGPTDFFAGEDVERIAASVEEMIETGAARTEADLVMKDGRQVPYEFRGRVLTDADGDVFGFCGVARDISERRERELERYETLIETAADGVYAQDADGCYTYVNSYVEEITGYDREELLGEHPSIFFDEEQVAAFREDIARLARGDAEVVSIEAEVTTADGEEIPMEGRITALPSEDRFEGTIGVIRDISDRKERERELERQRARLEEFAGVVSHDLRNPLNVAEGRLELARTECDTDHLDQVAAAHDRMRSLIDDLLELTREDGAIDLEPVALTETAERCWRTVDTRNGSLVLETDRTIRAAPGRLRQLLANLFRNSVEHGATCSRTTSGDSVEHGSTGSRTGCDDSVEHDSTSDQAEPDDGAVTVTVGDLPDGFYVADDGPGIPPDEREAVFEAGYSTRRGGTGLGLSIVSDVAAAHGWTVRVTESEAGGARFEITGVEDG